MLGRQSGSFKYFYRQRTLVELQNMNRTWSAGGEELHVRETVWGY